MKFVIAIAVLLAALTAHSEALVSQREVMSVANVFIDNPKVVTTLNKESVNIVEYSIEDSGIGVFTYRFKLDRVCFCVPRPGTLVVVQDMRPTYADGPIEYSHELTWDAVASK